MQPILTLLLVEITRNMGKIKNIIEQVRKYHYETIDVANNRNETLNMLYEKIKKNYKICRFF